MLLQLLPTFAFLLFLSLYSSDANEKDENTDIKLMPIPTADPVNLKKDLLWEFGVGNPCKQKNLCKNKGKCMHEKGSGFYCNCPWTHFGKVCQFLADRRHCYRHKCDNSGTCYSIDTVRHAILAKSNTSILVKYQCWCKKGYIGSFCEYSDNERLCAEDHCLHHGLAYRSPNADNTGESCKCQCEDFYSGERCQHMSPCKNHHCYNGGWCNVINGTASCVCPTNIVPYDFEYKLSGDRCQNLTRDVTKRFDAELTKCIVCNENQTVSDFRSCMKDTRNGPRFDSIVYQSLPSRDGPICENHSQCVPKVVNASSRYDRDRISAYVIPTCNCTDILTYGKFCQHSRKSLCDMTDEEIVALGRRERCLNRGNCVVDPELNTWMCLCSVGFRGHVCQIRDPCHPNPCSNGSTCVGLPEHIGTMLEYRKHTCICNMNQQLDIQAFDCLDVHYGPCAIQPCSGGSACFPCDIFGDDHLLCDERELDVGYHCVCKSGLYGPNCDNDFNPCTLNPCLNGGICKIVDKFDYLCMCGTDTGYTGSHCEIVDSICLAIGVFECAYGVCKPNEEYPKNYGYARGFGCICEENWTGDNCHLAVNFSFWSMDFYGENEHWILPLLSTFVILPILVFGLVIGRD